MGVQTITFQELEQSERGSVWITNSVESSELIDYPCEILINIPTAQGRPDLMKVPQSWLPFEVTAKFPKSRVLDSSEFRGAVGKGIITLISEAEAHKMLREDGAKEERNRLRALEAHVKAAGSVRSISDANVTITNPNELNAKNGTDVSVVGGAQEAPLSRQIQASGGQALTAEGLKPNFVTFFNKTKTLGDMEAVNAVRNKGRLNRKELRYIRDNLPNHPKTVKLVKSKLIELKREAMAAAAQG